MNKLERLCLLVLLAGCAESAAGEERFVDSVLPVDFGDAMSVTKIDLVFGPNASLFELRRQEVVVVDGPKTDDRGQVVTILATGAYAKGLERYGFRAEGHRSRRRSTAIEGEEEIDQLGPTECDWPIDTKLFPSFDDVPGAFNGGLANEMHKMAKPGVVVKDIATTDVGKRPVIAVRVGGGKKGEGTDGKPTVMIVADHHAREWVTVEVAMRLLREYVAAVGTDTQLGHLLEDVAVVFVPVVNPDGYQYSRTKDRMQRKNLNPICPSAPGVDVNRNYAFDWGVPADSGSTNPCDEVFIGPGPASEPEIVGVQKLLAGDFFPPSKTVAGLSYHSYADLVLYPDGLNYTGGATGPLCNPGDNCTTPDFQVYRRAFGDTENPMMFDVIDPKVAYPGSTDNNVLYSVSGDFKAFMNYSSPHSIGAVAELMGGEVGFLVECADDPEGQVSAIVDQQREVLRGLVEDAAGFGSTAAATAFGPNAFGKIALGMVAREASGVLTHETARPRFLVSRWAPSDNGSPLVLNIPGFGSAPLHKARTGAQYNLLYCDADELNPGAPWCFPCEIGVRDKDGTATFGPDACKGCVDLTDENRLPHQGWKLFHEDRGGVEDYFWTPVDTSSGDAILDIPGGTVNKPDLTYCHLSYTADWIDAFGDGRVYLERSAPGGGWETVTAWPWPDGPISEWRYGSESRLRSEIVETNNDLPHTASFRFRVPKGEQPPKGFKVFEPMTICRWGKKY